MSYPNIIDDINELEDKNLTLVHLLNYIYPVGSIYMSVNNVSPSSFLGGTWEQIRDTFLLCAGSSYMAGSTGGEATHTLTQTETPAHTHTRGTMDITGKVRLGWGDKTGGGIIMQSGYFAGAVYATHEGEAYYYADPNISNQPQHLNMFNFQASRNWTGETSSVGGNAAHNNMPPYLAVYVWKRTA